MNCTSAQKQLNTAFDDDAPLSENLRQHLDACPACSAYHQELESLDDLLRHTAPVEEDAAFVARIQAAVAQPRTASTTPWLGIAVALAVVVAAFAGGWAIDRYVTVPDVSLLPWQPDKPLLPEWGALQSELTTLPMHLRRESASFSTAIQELWERGVGILSAWMGNNNTLFWGGCILGLTLVVLIDSRELRRAS